MDTAAEAAVASFERCGYAGRLVLTIHDVTIVTTITCKAS